MIRVLQVVNDMHRAGLETMLMNYYRNIDRTKIQFDFLTHRPNRSDYDNEIEDLGGRLYYAPRLYPQNYQKYFHFMQTFWKEHPEYKIVHSHIDAMSYLPLLTAKKAGIPVRIAHSHNTSIDKDFKYLLKQFFRTKINSVANYRCACGVDAGTFLFKGGDYTIIPNAVERENFVFDTKIRNKVRENLNLDRDQLVIGHVGRFSKQKNHKFLIHIFYELNKIKNDSVLLLIGTGEKISTIKEYVHKLNLDKKVLFLGNRSDVNELYQAMDVFVLPSLFEGFPMVGVEAQFAGLPCIFSDKVSNEIKLNNNCQFIDLKAPIYKWVNACCEKNETERTNLNNSNLDFYDINKTSTILENYYELLLRENNKE